MMVSEYQPVRTDHNPGAEIAEIHYSILQAHTVRVIQFLRGKSQAQFLHYQGRLLVNLVEHPHAFVCFRVVNAKNKTQNSNKKSNFIHNLYF